MSRSLFLLFVLVFLASSACKGCGDPCKDVVCLEGEVCMEGICNVDQTPCDPACEDGQFCQAGTCVTPEAQCAAAGEECDASRPAGDGFLCLDLDAFGPRPGECVAPCAADGSCPSGALCFFVAAAADPSCTSNDDCAEGRECAGGQCLQTICRPSECDGFVEGASQCSDLYANVPAYASGAQCYNVGNGAQYCYPAGPGQEGDSCGAAIDAIIDNDFANTCASGLACVDNVCRVACVDDDVCTGDQECILEEQDFVDEGTGICGDACTPFEIGSCGAGETCIPVSGEEGVCAPAGDLEAFAQCVPGAGECADGMVCVTYQGDAVEVARCQPICNLTVAEPNEDGTVGEFAQTQRAATCPQPERSDSWLSVTNLADTGAAIDIYVGDEPTPVVAALALDESSDADPASPGDPWLSVPPGSVVLRILPAGAPRTDPSLGEQTINFVAGSATEVFVLPVAGALDDVTLVIGDAPRGETAAAAGSGKIRVVGALADVPTSDVIVVPVDDDLTEPANQVELATGLAPEQISAFTEVMAGAWDLLVFAAGDPRTDRTTALVAGTIDIIDGSISTLAVRGTVDPDDQPLAGFVLAPLAEPPPTGQGGPAFTCVDPGGGAFGFCQQSCGSDSSGFDGLCEGDGFGCHPTFLPANNRWSSLCAPQGEKAIDDPCDPFAEFSECGEGLYCLEYGNEVANFDVLQRGRCTSLCVEGVTSDPILNCPAEQACQTLSFRPDYLIGQCGFPCEPGTSYGDDTCPAGLASCKPRSALVDDVQNPDALPEPVVAQSFCSASGNVAAGDRCGANDCVPGSECMFPRSEQATFTSTLLSQYFGAAGLAPACMPQCDPFEGDSSASTCAAGETCLFNFPYSAEVGHCTEIDIELEPLEPCPNPGRSCGRDSICVVNAGAPTCFQFCQYTGPDASGELQPESCAAGFLCAPLVNDVGVCLSPG